MENLIPSSSPLHEPHENWNTPKHARVCQCDVTEISRVRSTKLCVYYKALPEQSVRRNQAELRVKARYTDRE